MNINLIGKNEKNKYSKFKQSLLGQGMEDKPWYLDYRTHMVFLVALIAYILMVFW